MRRGPLIIAANTLVQLLHTDPVRQESPAYIIAQRCLPERDSVAFSVPSTVWASLPCILRWAGQEPTVGQLSALSPHAGNRPPLTWVPPGRAAASRTHTP